MHNNDIKTSTPVRHPEGGDYVIQRQSMNGAGEVLTIAIGKDLHASAVFDGSPDEARRHGFLFGDETTEPETWEDKDGVISDLRGEVKTLTEQLAACQKERSAAIVARGAADRGLESFKTQVRDTIIAAAKENDLCREGTNSVLSDLGLDEWKATYKVTVTRDDDGETILTVTGIEADSEGDAEQEVRNNFRVSATVKRVKYDYEYDGEGEEDWDAEDYDDSDLSDDDDCGFADAHKDNLTFSAEEE